MNLYVYDHCPFCVKARAIFGLKKMPMTLKVLANDDEATPIKMVGQKMLPILEKDDGTFMPESMDIVYYVDGLSGPSVLGGAVRVEIGQWLVENQKLIHQLVMPRSVHIGLAEFATESARDYYIKKKQAYLGPFTECMLLSPNFIKQMNQQLLVLETVMRGTEACNGTELSTDDIHLFAVLRNLSMVKGLVYPAKVAAYRVGMAERTQVPLFDEVAI
ncbi:MAG: glutaredoxin 2 [Neisseriaceae bacterium]|nr:glutaredoxin 2 [Neisseriaceae bacterium]